MSVSIFGCMGVVSWQHSPMPTCSGSMSGRSAHRSMIRSLWNLRPSRKVAGPVYCDVVLPNVLPLYGWMVYGHDKSLADIYVGSYTSRIAIMVACQFNCGRFVI